MNKFLENVLLTNCQEGCRLWKLDIDHQKISQFRIIVVLHIGLPSKGMIYVFRLK